MTQKVSKQSKPQDFKEVLVQQMDEYTNKAFTTEKPEERELYREIIRQMQELFVLVCKVG